MENIELELGDVNFSTKQTKQFYFFEFFTNRIILNFFLLKLDDTSLVSHDEIFNFLLIFIKNSIIDLKKKLNFC